MRDLDQGQKSAVRVQKHGHHLGFFHHPPLVSCCGWKASQEGGGAGETKSQFVGRSGERKSQAGEWRQPATAKFLRGGDTG